MSDRQPARRPSIAPSHASATVNVNRARVPAMLAGMAILLGGCVQYQPKLPPASGHIAAPAVEKPAAASIPPPARVPTLVPPPAPQVKAQTYSVVVNEVPVKELLLALARDTKQNIDIHPGLSGLVSLNAINETLPAILERISKQVNLRYRTEGNTIIVSPDVAYVKTYRVNYVNINRDMTSNIGVSGEIATSTGSGGSGGATTSGSTTSVRSSSNNNFWEQLRLNILGILNSTRLQSLTADARAERRELIKQDQDLRVRQIEAASKAGQGAPNLASATIGNSTNPQQASLVPDDVVVNAVSGTITVNATDMQHQLVQKHIDSVTSAIQRQVLIEATIVEVLLSDGFQAGIDWSRLPISGGLSITQTLLGGFNSAATGAGATSGNAMTIAYTNPTTNLGNISGTVKFLEEFGSSKVLSSPKLMAMNNQTALLKVVDNLVYFEIKADTTTSTTGPTQTTFNTTAKSVSVGVVMGVTPQINEDGRVLLNVRPTITRLNTSQPFVNDPNPSLCDTTRTNCIANRVPQIQVREMESVLQVVSGQTVILGGLMQDSNSESREQIPGADALGAAGDLLRFRNQGARKSELVIFLRPTVVANPSLDSDELKFFKRFLPPAETATAPKPAAP